MRTQRRNVNLRTHVEKEGIGSCMRRVCELDKNPVSEGYVGGAVDEMQAERRNERCCNWRNEAMTSWP
jgi:hypothetical protein